LVSVRKVVLDFFALGVRKPRRAVMQFCLSVRKSRNNECPAGRSQSELRALSDGYAGEHEKPVIACEAMTKAEEIRPF
jgi:hypothetical protein